MATTVEPMEKVFNVGGTIVFVRCEVDNSEDVAKNEATEHTGRVGGVGWNVKI